MESGCFLPLIHHSITCIFRINQKLNTNEIESATNQIVENVKIRSFCCCCCFVLETKHIGYTAYTNEMNYVLYIAESHMHTHDSHPHASAIRCCCWSPINCQCFREKYEIDIRFAPKRNKNIQSNENPLRMAFCSQIFVVFVDKYRKFTINLSLTVGHQIAVLPDAVLCWLKSRNVSELHTQTHFG